MTLLGDYPDWVRVDQNTQQSLINVDQVGLAAGAQLGPFYVGDADAVSFDFEFIGGAADAMQAELAFGDAQGVGNPIGSVFYTARASTPIVDVCATQGTSLLVNLLGWAGARTVRQRIVKRRTVLPSARMYSGAPLWENPGVAVGAGVTLTTLLTPVMAARCVLSVTSFATIYSVYVDHLSLAGAGIGRLHWFTTTTGAVMPTIALALPPGPCTINLVNGDAAGKTFAGAIVPFR